MPAARILAPLLACSLLVAACGDDDADTSETTTTSSTTTAPASTDSDGDRAIAEAGLLQLSDFPAGWEAEPAGEDADESESTQRIADCIGVDHDRLYGGASEAESPTFSSPDGVEVSNTAGVEASEDEAIFVFETLSSDEAIACISDEFETFITELGAAEGLEIGDATLERASAPDVGDDAEAYRLTVPIEAEGQSVEVFVDIVVARVGRGGITLQALSLLEPFDGEQLATYVTIAVERLGQALQAS